MIETNDFYLPEELVISNILPRLPVKSLVRFKSISKRYNSIISSPYFARLHLNKSISSDKNNRLLINHKTCFLSLDFESNGDSNKWDCSPFNDNGAILSDKYGLTRVIDISFQVPHSHLFVVGSSDGLVCLKTKYCSLYIWNPSSFEVRKIPFPKEHKKLDVVWGFGYIKSENDYKVIRICQNRSNNEKSIQVFSLSENNWTYSQEELHGYGERFRLTGLGVTVSDVTYWLYKGYEVKNPIRWWIMGFDWVLGKIKRVPLPEWYDGGFERPQLRPLVYVMEGCLCACWVDSQAIEVGMLKEENGSHSWTRLNKLSQSIVFYSMTYGHQDLPNITTKSRIAIKDGRDRNTLLLIDPAQEPDKVHLPTLRIPNSRNVVNYTESLISPFVGLKQTQRNDRKRARDNGKFQLSGISG